MDNDKYKMGNTIVYILRYRNSFREGGNVFRTQPHGERIYFFREFSAISAYVLKLDSKKGSQKKVPHFTLIEDT